MRSRRWLGLAVGIGSLALARGASATMVVNCIGEQTTNTTEGVPNDSRLWPQELQPLLGNDYLVNNDGVSTGKVTDVPAATSALSPASLMGSPSIIIIGPFAENDYAPGLTEATWQADYRKLVDAYLALTPQPTIYVMTPPPAAFVYQSAAEQTFATSVVKPAVLAVAAGDNSANKTLKVIDLFDDAALGTADDSAGGGLFNASGHFEVAMLAYECITMNMCGGADTSGSGGAGGGAAGSSAGGGAAGGSAGGAGGGAGGAAGAASTGASGAGGQVAGGAGAAGAAGAGAGQHASSGGCSVAGTGGAYAVGLLILTAMVVLTASRRRRS
ncbi:MAG TPA: MYXO-CTERM sorting domain-containing protein [Polyangia bacterium]|nr:MYXO-CTERM sorting domain-containing protein [Polyangia bacterium]